MYTNSISNHNNRRDEVFSHDNNKPGTRTQQTGNNPDQILHADSKSSVNDLKDAFSQHFSKNAAAKDSFHKLMRQTFTQIADPETSGSAANYNYDKAETLRQQALDGDLSWLPEVEVLSNAEFSKAQLNEGAPSSATPLGAFGDSTIFLNESVLSDPKLALRVYSEEAGHALDKVLNQNVDSAGDEGALFSKLLMNEPLSTQQIQALKAENDQGVLKGTDPAIITPDFISNPIDINIPDTNIGNIPGLTLDPAIITPDFASSGNTDYFSNLPTYDLDPLLIGGVPSIYDVIVSLDALDAPDGDGIQTFSELNFHRRNGNGTDLHADASKLDLSGIRSSYFDGVKPNPDGSKTKTFNLLNPYYAGYSLRDGFAYGKVELTLLPNSGGQVTIKPDTYDFDVPGDIYQGLSTLKEAAATFRNLETVGANLLIGGGTPFTIIFDGVGQIRED